MPDITTPAEYVRQLPQDRKKPVSKIRSILRKNLPKGFKEQISYKMIGYVVPHSIYPEGYHCDSSQPLPFINLASQKNYIALYHMGIYSNDKLNKWFIKEYLSLIGKKPDMGKSCIRFKKPDEIPYELIAELAGKMTPQEWIKIYEKNRP